MRPNSDSSNCLSELSDIFDLTSQVKDAIFFKLKTEKTLIDVMLKSKLKYLFKSHNFVLDQSEFHKLTESILRELFNPLFSPQKPLIIEK